MPRCPPLRQGGIRHLLWCIAFGLLGLGVAAAQDPSERRNATPGQFDFYVLALSWSPGFCALTDGRNQDQCGAEGSIGRGFVVHGLWPQFVRGYPTECAADRSPTRATIASAVPPFPTQSLARYQWRKHGSCSGLAPEAYFNAVKAAYALVQIPAEFSAMSDQKMLSPIELERRFAAGSPRLRPDMMSVQCRRGRLQEVRICLSRDLKGFVSCQEVDRDTCRNGRITMDAMNVPQ
jgi:ribonuclease T2